MDSELINIPDAIRVIAAALQEARFGLKLRTEQKSLFKNVKSCFLGSEAVDVMSMNKTMFHVVDRGQGIRLCQHLLQGHYIAPMEKAKTLEIQPFKDDRATMYYFKVFPLALDPGYMEKHLNPSAKRLIATDPSVVQPPQLTDKPVPVSPRDKGVAGAPVSPQGGKGPLARAQLTTSQSSPQIKRAAPAPSAALTASGILAPPTGQGRSSHMGLDTSGPVRDAAAARDGLTAGGASGVTVSQDDDDEGNGITYQIDSVTGANVIKLATEERLIEKLTEENTEVHLIKTFIAVYQSFMTPAMLLQRLIARYLQCSSTEENEKRKTIIQLRVFSVLKMWIESDFDDFDDSMRASITDFIAHKVGPGQQNAVATLKRTLEKKEAGPATAPHEPPAVTDDIRDISFLEVDVGELAKAITVTEHELYASIKRREFLKLAWAKPGKEQAAPNILRMIDHTNQLIRWVTAEICTTLQLKQRGQVLAKFIGLAQRLFSMNNFNGLMEILAALNSAPVRRLKNTWAELSEEQASGLKQLEQVMSHESSYKNYRAALKGASPPAVPYLGTFLTDITFIEEGNKSKIDDMIHYYKWNLVGRHIIQIQQFQSVHGFAQPSDRRLLGYCAFIKTKGVTDAEAYNLSLKIEPRNPSEAFEEMLMEEERLRREVQALQLRNAQLEEEVDSLKAALRVLNAKARKSMKLEGEIENLRLRISRGIDDYTDRAKSPQRSASPQRDNNRQTSPQRDREVFGSPSQPPTVGSASTASRAGLAVPKDPKQPKEVAKEQKEKDASAPEEQPAADPLPRPSSPNRPTREPLEQQSVAAQATPLQAPPAQPLPPVSGVLPQSAITPPVSPRSKPVAPIVTKQQPLSPRGAIPQPIKPLSGLRASSAVASDPQDKSPRKAVPGSVPPFAGAASLPSTSPTASQSALLSRAGIFQEIPPLSAGIPFSQPLPVFTVVDAEASSSAPASSSSPPLRSGGSHVGERSGGSHIVKPTTWAAPRHPGENERGGESRRATALLSKTPSEPISSSTTAATSNELPTTKSPSPRPAPPTSPLPALPQQPPATSLPPPTDQMPLPLPPTSAPPLPTPAELLPIPPASLTNQSAAKPEPAQAPIAATTPNLTFAASQLTSPFTKPSTRDHVIKLVLPNQGAGSRGSQAPPEHLVNNP